MSKKIVKRTKKTAPSGELPGNSTANSTANSTGNFTGKFSDNSASNASHATAGTFPDDSRVPSFLPFNAEFMPATEKRFQETVVFVHHFGGNKDSLSHHVKMVNDLGYDAVRFNLMFSQINPTKHFPITANLKFGIRHVWSEQIEAILNATPGRKIVFSFSMPSNSVLMALARRHAKDVSAWICDGGPFLQLPKCVWNLYEHHYEIKSKVIRGALTGASLLFYGMGFEKEAAGLVRALPANFRVLSFRGMQDPMVPAEAIDELLIGAATATEKSSARKDTGRLSVETHSFEEGGHLDGLKNYSDAYRDHCESFLKSASQAFSA